MCASPTQIEANRRNAEKSCGPKSPETKARSRANALRHGLTGDGVVLIEADAAEVERLTEAYRREMDAPGEAGEALVRRMAVLTVRMDRCVAHEEAAVKRNVRKALEEFVPPEGATPEQVAKLRAEVMMIAEFDTSKEANLARRYEAAAERGFFRAMKEIGEMKPAEGRSTASEAAQLKRTVDKLGSFFPVAAPVPAKPVPAPSKPVPTTHQPLPPALKKLPADWNPSPATHFDLPIAIGKPR